MKRVAETLFLSILMIAPYGIGFNGIGFFKSLDLPKILMVLSLFYALKYKCYRVENSRIFIFNLLVLSHLSFAVLCFNNIAIRDFLYTLIFGYAGGYLGISAGKKELNNFRPVYWSLVTLITLSIVEFIVQYNFIDDFRNLYQSGKDGINFNDALGMRRLGLKASMGNYASTTPFAYVIVTLYAFLALEAKKKMPILLTISTLTAVIFTLSRGALLVFLVFLVFNNIKSLRTIVLFSVIIGFGMVQLTKNRQISNYLENYVFSIVDDRGKDGLSARISNNTTDFEMFASAPLIGNGPGQLLAVKQGLVAGHDATSDSGILTFTIIDRGIIGGVLLLVLVANPLIWYVKSKFVAKKYLLILVPFGLLSISYRFEFLFIFYFILMFSNARRRKS